MRILVFGGSFDPPHVGHAALLQAAARTIRPDSIIIVPAWRNPHKSRRPVEPAERVTLARLGLVGRLPPRWRRAARVDDGEARSGRPVYTVQTLERLSRQFPSAELHFVCGWDAAVAFPSWNAPLKLRTLARWWTAGRPGAAGKPPAFFKKIPGRMPDASSSEIRALLVVGDDVSHLLDARVRRRIEARGLYGLDRLATLRAMLGPERFEHSRCVARLAGALARRWEAGEEEALVAGLLHDCGRAIPVHEMPAYARRNGLAVPRREQAARRQPIVLHAYVGEHVCRTRLGVRDASILSAIRKHTLGAAAMSPLDTIVYVADACSEDRRYPGAAGMRKLAFEDLPRALRACVAQKLSYCLEKRSWIHPETVNLWNRLAD